MIYDRLGLFADDADPSGSSGSTVLVGSVIDFGGAAGSVMNVSPPMWLVVQVTEALVGVGASVNFRFVTDAVNPPATDGSETLMWESGATAITSLGVGARFVTELPLVQTERYGAIHAAITGANVTAGAVSAFFSDTRPYYAPFTAAPIFVDE